MKNTRSNKRLGTLYCTEKEHGLRDDELEMMDLCIADGALCARVVNNIMLAGHYQVVWIRINS